ncbi:MAG: sporulation protein [Bacteroidota bacterium]
MKNEITMFGRVKRYLGIEGVKVEVEVPEKVRISQGQIEGKVRFLSMNEQSVTSVKVKLFERYSRGRGEEKKIDEYTLGEIEMQTNLQVTPDEAVEIEFILPFSVVRSEVDDFAAKNLLFKGIAKAAKKIYAAQSDYYLLAEAKVKGTALPPFCREKINLL